MRTVVMHHRHLRHAVYKNKLPNTVQMTVRFGDIPQNVRKRVVSALERGFLLAWSGPTAEVFELVTKAYGIPAVKVRRQMESRWTYPRWIFDWKLKSQKMEELFKADEVAVRMSDDPKLKETTKHRYIWGGNVCLYMLKDPKMLEEAFAEAMEPYQEQIKEAIRAIEGGEPILITHV
jgi:hypothetical protein